MQWTQENQSSLIVPDRKLLTQVSGVQNFPMVKRIPIQADSEYLSKLGLGELAKQIDLSYWQTLVNPENGHPYNVVTDLYNLIPYEEQIKAVETAIRKHPEFGPPVRNIKLHPEGDRMHVSYRFPECTEDVGHGDEVQFQAGLWTSYDGSWPLIIDGGAYRLICTNGLTVGKRVIYFRHKHTKSLDLDRIVMAFDGALERYADEVGLWRKWVDITVMPDDYEAVMKTMNLGKKATEEVESEVEVSSGLYLNDPKMKTLTVWLLFNILAQFITHKVKSQLRQAEHMANMRTAFEKYRR